MTTWFRSETGRPNVEIGIEPPCDGSPQCSGAIHLRRTNHDGSETWVELHLTSDEIDRVITLLATNKMRAES